MKKILYTSLIVALSILLTIQTAAAVYALEERDYGKNSIYFYKEGVSETSCVAPSLSNTPAGERPITSQPMQPLPSITRTLFDNFKVKEKFQKNLSAYTAAERATKVPAVMLAALHYREGGMDPKKSIADGEPLGKKVSIDGVRIGDTLEEDAIYAAEHFRKMAKDVYRIDISASMTTAEKGQAFLAYNRGHLYKRAGLDYTKSGYVMQGIDDGHMGGDWIYLDPFGGHSKSRQLKNRNPGALAFLAYMGDSTAVADCKPEGVPATFAAYSQCEGSWKNLRYSSGNFCSSACGVVSAAMILSTLKKQSITPDAIVANVRKYGGEVPGIGSNTNNIQRMMVQEYGLRGENLSAQAKNESYQSLKNKVNTALDKGAVVYTSGRGGRPFTNGGHIIVIYKRTVEGKWLVGDPAGSTSSNASRKVLQEYDQDAVAAKMHHHLGALYAQ